jgi:antitoxin component of RelBE/YafQ-DinJ toxin-antitoxin module
MNTSINLKIDGTTKEALSKRAKKLNITLSEYIRKILDGTINSNNAKNPLLGLVGTLSNKEAENMDQLIKTSRRNKKM